MTSTKPIDVLPFDAAEYLKDEKSIAAFLNASREMNDPAVFLNALSTVARARSMTELAVASGPGRESLYKALRPGAQPRYDTVLRVMEALGVEMVFQAKRQPDSAKQGVGAVASRVVNKAVSASRPAKAPARTRSGEVRAMASVKPTGSSAARRPSRRQTVSR